MLKKEFTQRDVTRARNLITGKVHDRTAIQSGYEKHEDHHEEGDIWEEKGKKWTIKNGIKQTVTKFDALKSLVHLPLSCPTCKKAMKVTDLNKKMYFIHKMCFDCVIVMETELKAKGKYKDYEKQILNQNKNSMLEDLEQALDSWVYDSESYVSEDGVVESWSSGQDKTDSYNEFKEVIKKSKETEI